MFEKGIYLFVGIIGLTNLFLFILSIYYEINLFNSSYERFIEIQKFFKFKIKIYEYCQI